MIATDLKIFQSADKIIGNNGRFIARFCQYGITLSI